MSLLVTVHVLSSPTATVPVQPAEKLCAYPDGPLSPTEYDPAFSATSVPGEAAPGNEPGVGELPVTDIVNAEAVAVPPLSLMTVLITCSFGWMSSFVMVQVFVSPIA